MGRQGGVPITWTKHAEERQQAWERRLGVTRQEIELAVESPEQVVHGDLGALVAQRHRGDGLLRVVFVETEAERRIITVYWTSRIQRYWQA